MSKAPFRPDLKGRQKQAFQEASPQVFAKVGRDPGAVEQLGLIERRAAALKEKVRAHHRKYEESWVAKEAIQLWQKRSGLTADHPAPTSVPGAYVAQSIMGQARRNVTARATRRLIAINEIKTRMENAVVRTRHQRSRKQDAVPGPDQKPRYAIKPTFTRNMRHD